MEREHCVNFVESSGGPIDIADDFHSHDESVYEKSSSNYENNTRV